MAEISNSASGARGDRGMLKRVWKDGRSGSPLHAFTRVSQKAMTRERVSHQICTPVRGSDLNQADFSEMGGHPNLPLANLKIWQGWKESNLRMPESKSGALTNLATPLHGTVVAANNRPINRLSRKLSQTVLFIPT